MVNAQQGFHVEHEALQLAANRLPQQSSALTKIRGAVTAHVVPGESFGKVSGSSSAASSHSNNIQQLAQNLDEHAKKIDALTQGVSSSDDEVKAFDDQQSGKQKTQGAAIPGAEIIHNADGTDSFLITPANKSWDPFTLPNTAGNNHGFNLNNPPGFFDASHTYSVDTPTKIPWDTGREALQQSLIDNPVPNDTHVPATPDGATNDALSWASSKVSSYVVPSQDPSRYTDMVVNYTQPGHTLDPGYVLRRGALQPDGTITIQTWGEGRAWQQSWPIGWFSGAIGDYAWGSNQQDIANKAMQRLGIPH